jgi:peptidyl-prolyl cis-trans isomerase D
MTLPRPARAGTRTSALGQADDIVREARQDPASFGQIAKDQSEDASSAAKGGELGWVAHYQLDAVRDEAVFALTEIDQISDPVVTSNGIYIYKLEDTSPARYLPEAQRSQISNSGYTRWLAEIKDRAGIWVDPQYAPASTTG